MKTPGTLVSGEPGAVTGTRAVPVVLFALRVGHVPGEQQRIATATLAELGHQPSEVG